MLHVEENLKNPNLKSFEYILMVSVSGAIVCARERSKSEMESERV